jgi:hypothetical protein
MFFKKKKTSYRSSGNFSTLIFALKKVNLKKKMAYTTIYPLLFCFQCCKTVPKQTEACKAEKGECVDEDLCYSGKKISDKCGEQPNGVTCCLPETTITETFSNVDPCRTDGGYCMPTDKCPAKMFHKGTGKCPGQATNVKASLKWLKWAEMG